MREFLLETYTDDEAETCIRHKMQEVVRCMDCKRGARLERTGMMPMVTCKGEDHDLDWFCADGERKTD